MKWAITAASCRATLTCGLALTLLPAFCFSQNGTDLFRAQALLAAGNLQDAETAVRTYLASHADSPDAHYLLGLILFEKSDARGSLAEYTLGAKQRPPNASDLIIVGSDYVQLHDFSDASKWFAKAAEFEPYNVKAWYYLGRSKYNENRFEEAISAFQRCLELEPKHVKAEDNLGLSYQGLQRTEDAEKAFRTAIAWQDSDPKDPGPFIDLGAFLLANDRPSESTAYLEKAVAMAPEDDRARVQLGKAYLKLNRLPQAEQQLAKAVSIKPGDASIHYVLGQVYRKEGRTAQAELEFSRYTELSGTHSVSVQP